MRHMAPAVVAVLDDVLSILHGRGRDGTEREEPKHSTTRIIPSEHLTSQTLCYSRFSRDAFYHLLSLVAVEFLLAEECGREIAVRFVGWMEMVLCLVMVYAIVSDALSPFRNLAFPFLSVFGF